MTAYDPLRSFDAAVNFRSSETTHIFFAFQRFAMKRLMVVSALALAVCAHPAVAGERMIRCKALASWGCNEDGICIDSTAIRGKPLKFDLKRQTFEGRGLRNEIWTGSILSEERDELGRRVLVLSEDQRLVLNMRRDFDESIGRDRVRSNLYSKRGYLELECD